MNPYGPDEAESVALMASWACFGARVGGRVSVPLTPAPGAPELVVPELRWASPAEFIAEGRFTGHDWADDPAIGWWAEAAHPDHDAVRVVSAAAAGRGQVALIATHRRLTVAFPRKLIAGEDGGGVLGRVFGSRAEWESGDLPHIELSVDASRVTGFGPVLLGRSIPAPAFVAVGFADRSTLYLRHADPVTQVDRLRAVLGR